MSTLRSLNEHFVSNLPPNPRGRSGLKFGMAISLCFVMALTIASCKSSNPTGPSTPTGGTGIGPNGGTVTSADGKASLVIPAGALSSNQSIAITPKTGSNGCPQAIDSGYDLTPKGLTFSTPAMLTLNYDTTIAGANAELIGVASQEDTGSWYAWTGGLVDTIHHTVTVPITHFSGDVGYLSFEIAPSNAVVLTGSSTPLGVYQVGPPANSPAGTQVALTNPFALGGAVWKVVDGGGSLSSGVGLNTDYMAPATMPSPNQVTISATITTNGQKFQPLAFLNVIAQNWTLTGVDSLSYDCSNGEFFSYTDVSGGYMDIQIDAGGSGATGFAWFPNGPSGTDALCPEGQVIGATYTIDRGHGMSLTSVNSGGFIPSNDAIYLFCSEQGSDLPGYTVTASALPQPINVAVSPGHAFNSELVFKNLSRSNTVVVDESAGSYTEYITWTLTAQ